MKEILLNIDKGIAMVSMNRPHVMNVINNELLDRLNEVLDICATDTQIRCVVISGEGKWFCAGCDLDYIESLDSEQVLEFYKKLGTMIDKLYNLSKPVIAMVNGVASGSGFNIALACDMIYADQKARFTQTASKVGLIPDLGGLFFLPKAVGKHKAKELMFLAEPLSCTNAYRMGLINQVCHGDSLYEETTKVAKKLAAVAQLPISLIKKYVNDDSLDLNQILEIERMEQLKCLNTDDFKEGIAAFREKRTPRFLRKNKNYINTSEN